MTNDVRHELGKEERVALTVLGFGSLFSLIVGFIVLLYQSKIIGFILVSFSGLLLLVVLIINSLHYTNPRTYHRLAFLLNPNAALREVHPTRPADDSPPSYKKSWAKDFQQRTTTSSSTTTGAGGSDPQQVDIDLERHLVGWVGRGSMGNNRPEWRMLKGKRSQEACVQRALKSNQELHNEEYSSPPPFEVAILELSAKELEKINENLPQSNSTSTNDTLAKDVRFPTVQGITSDVFSVEQEFLRGSIETTYTTFPSRKTELEVA